MSRSRRWDWLRGRMTQPKQSKSKAAGRHSFEPHMLNRSLRMEVLEDRRMLATFTVSNLLDGPVAAAGDLPGSLRQAIYDANASAGADEIVFDAALPKGLLEHQEEFVITESLDIQGPGALRLTIGKDGFFLVSPRMFNFTATTGDFSISGLTLATAKPSSVPSDPGPSVDGGSVRFASSGTLTIADSVIQQSRTYGSNSRGLAVYSAGDVTISRSVIGSDAGRLTGNTDITPVFAVTSAVYAEGDATVLQSLFASNAYSALHAGNNVDIRHSTFAFNFDQGSAPGVQPQIVFSNQGYVSHSIFSNETVTGGGTRQPIFQVGLGGLTIEYSIVTDNLGTSLVEAPVGSPDVNGNFIGGTTNGLIDTKLEPRRRITPLASVIPSLLMRPESPAIDQGNPSFDPATFSPPLDSDIRGVHFPRVVDGVGDDVSRIDIGATEFRFHEVTMVVTSLSEANNTNHSFNDLSLREATIIAGSTFADERIEFDATLFADGLPKTIFLESGGINIGPIDLDGSASITGSPGSITIIGPGSSKLILDGTGIEDGLDSGNSDIIGQSGFAKIPSVGISGLTVTGGPRRGISIHADDSTTISDVIVTNNPRGGIRAYSSKLGSTLLLSQATITNNGQETDSLSGQFFGGGAYLSAQFATVKDSIVQDNTVDTGGGGISYGFYFSGSLAEVGTLEIRDSTVTGNTSFGRGGGVYIGCGIACPLPQTDYNSSVKIHDSTIDNNRARFGGGGIFNSTKEGDVSVYGSSVTGNSASWSVFPELDAASGGGGGIFSNDDVLISGSTVSENTSDSFQDPSEVQSAFAGGGGIKSHGTTVINNSIISDNQTLGGSEAGGGIRAAIVELVDSVISGNRTLGVGSIEAGGGYVTPEAYGGGISASTVNVTRSIISYNSTQGVSSGGAIAAREVVIVDSVLHGNSTSGDSARGGAIATGGNVQITGSTFFQNTTAGVDARGSAIFSFGDIAVTQSTITDNATTGSGANGAVTAFGEVTAILSTIANNRASGVGQFGSGGINLVDSVSVGDGDVILNEEDIVLFHSIVAGNLGGDHPDLKPSAHGGLASNHSLIGTNEGTALSEAPIGSPDAAGNLIGGPTFGLIDPLLGPLGNYGGLTPTVSLRSGSPAIDAGAASFPADPPNDQRGAPFNRIVDGGVNGAVIDIGAYERQTIPGLNLIVDTTDDENDGDYSAGDLSLREAIGLANGSIGSNTITFNSTIAGETIALELGELVLNEELTINGFANQQVAIDAQQQSRIFHIPAGSSDPIALSGLKLTGGLASGDSALFRQGGAIYSGSSNELNITDSIITGNTADGEGSNGGGISANGVVYLTRTTLSDNQVTVAGNGGGLFSVQDVLLLDSTIANNQTAGPFGSGGGVRTFGSIFTLNSTISGNRTAGTSARGAGLAANGSVSLTSTTVADNLATGGNSLGEAIRAGSGITLDHSIVVSEPNSTGTQDLLTFGGAITASHSIIGDSTGTALVETLPGTVDGNGNRIGGPTNGAVDARLAALKDNGGPTLTHMLRADSPAIDAGDPNFNQVLPPDVLDQRGLDRFVDGNNDATAVIDIGAVEVQLPSADFDGDGDVDGADFLTWQRGFGTPDPDALKVDGDSDNDLDVDATDLAIWEGQFGAATSAASSLAAIRSTTLTSRIDATLSTSVAKRSEFKTNADLIDAVMAMESLGAVAGRDEVQVFEDTSVQEVIYESTYEASGNADLPHRSVDIEHLAASSDEDEKAASQWLEGDLLEKVFG